MLNYFGFAYLPEEMVLSGQLIEVLGDWCPVFSGFHLYYPHRRYASRAFSLLVEALWYRG